MTKEEEQNKGGRPRSYSKFNEPTKSYSKRVPESKWEEIKKVFDPLITQMINDGGFDLKTKGFDDKTSYDPKTENPILNAELLDHLHFIISFLQFNKDLLKEPNEPIFIKFQGRFQAISRILSENGFDDKTHFIKGFENITPEEEEEFDFFKFCDVCGEPESKCKCNFHKINGDKQK